MVTKEQLLEAVKVTNQLYSDYARNGIADEDLPIIKKYEALGLVKMVKRKGGVQKNLYFPLIHHPIFDGVLSTIFVRILRAAALKYGIKNAEITDNSISTYLNSPWRYNLGEFKDCMPKTGSYIKDKKEKYRQLLLWDELASELE